MATISKELAENPALRIIKPDFLLLPVNEDGYPYIVEHEGETTVVPAFTNQEALMCALEAGLIEMKRVLRVVNVKGFIATMPPGVRVAVNPERDGAGIVQYLCITRETPVFSREEN